MSEKRSYPRIEGNLALKLCAADCDLVTETKNISGSGAYCAVNKAIAPMTKLDIVLLVPLNKANHKNVKKINCKGVVVRSEHVQDNGKQSYCLGIYFSEIKETDRRCLMSYLTSISKPSNIF
ncbi:MAG: PilZ domain-containing protein [Candidatus Omnitrophica bacterium]|jgi:c-di-GMP-binding flagellar brake protein YcgR|nr:PilZ domain-containing protein [Candidatus Omnitrophota bacterium]